MIELTTYEEYDQAHDRVAELLEEIDDLDDEDCWTLRFVLNEYLDAIQAFEELDDAEWDEDNLRFESIPLLDPDFDYSTIFDEV